MHDIQNAYSAPRPDKQRSIFTQLLRGYRFSVCEDAASVARALEVRRQVYRDTCGYDVPIPDEYDGRSWLLLAEDVRTGEAVGSMRVTPRAAGPLEAEEYFALPPALRSARVVEITRFAVLPNHRDSRRFLPVVALGLFKLVSHFVVAAAGAEHAIVCSKAERIWSYEWMRFKRSGLVARYTKLGGAEHELMASDLRSGVGRHSDHRYWAFFFEIDHPEVVLPTRLPEPGLRRQAMFEPLPLKRSA